MDMATEAEAGREMPAPSTPRGATTESSRGAVEVSPDGDTAARSRAAAWVPEGEGPAKRWRVVGDH
eukprot:14322026-Alexandrium_andersonii.AAC.1